MNRQREATASSLPRVALFTLGCRLNQAETAALTEGFRQEGFPFAGPRDPADITVINTCTVTERGDTDARRLVLRALRRNPKTRVALIGCQAQVQKDDLARLPNVSWIVGNGDKMRLPRLIREDASPPTCRVLTAPPEKGLFTQPYFAMEGRRTRAHLKIQDGCDFFCSFCEIPFARGRARSRDPQDILREARALTDAGYQEIVLTGINIGTYRSPTMNFLNIVKHLCRIPGLRRIRISSIEPTTIPWELIEFMADTPVMCRHLHIPLQSADDEVLTAMKRRYTLKAYDAFLHKVRRLLPDAFLATDLIVGFPAEKAAAFERTHRYLHDSPLDGSHIFRYSPRWRAPSRKETSLPDSVVSERGRILREAARHKRKAFLSRHARGRLHVLFETKKNGFWEGLTSNYIRVRVPSSRDLGHQFHWVTPQRVDEEKVEGYLDKDPSLEPASGAHQLS